MKKILFISSSSAIGGGPRVMWEIIRRVQNEYDCTVITPAAGEYFARYKEAHIPVYAVPVRSCNPFVIFLMLMIIKKVKPNLIHTHGKGAGIHGRMSAWFARVPCIHTMHGVQIREYSRFSRFFYCCLEKILTQITKRVVCVSLGEQNEIAQLGLAPAKKLYVIRNGIDIEKYHVDNAARERARRELYIPPGMFLLITVGRLVFPKNFQEFVHIIASVRVNAPNITAILVGDGDEREDIQEFIEKNNMRDTVRLLGERDDVPELLAASDLYLSTSRWEGMPLSVLEAMASRVPVVASRVVGNSNLISDGETGFLYSLGNAKEAAEKIITLLEDDKLRRSISASAYDMVARHYTIEKMVSSHRELYHDTLRYYDHTK